LYMLGFHHFELLTMNSPDKLGQMTVVGIFGL